MDTKYPHDILEFADIFPDDRARYIPVPERVVAMNPDERAKFLASLRARMVNVARTSAVAQQVADKLQAVINPLIDKMDENGKDEEQAPLILGLLVGCRVFVGSFKGLEDEIAPKIIGECGISRDGYDSMCVAADAHGIQAVELVKRLIEEEDRLAPEPTA